jgi:RNA polymerase sigma-70 factor (ECF subfamily)
MSPAHLLRADPILRERFRLVDSEDKEGNDESVEPDPSHADESRARERALIERVRNDDGDAFAMLVTEHLPRLTRFATYLLGSADAAEDCVQMVFVHLWKRRHELDVDRPLRPYLLRAVQNRSLNEHRAETVRMKYRNRIQVHAAAGTLATNVPSPEEQILTEAMVQAALAQLPERRQLALRLRLEEGLTDHEVADTLGISLMATDRLIRRALANLRDILLVSK